MQKGRNAGDAPGDALAESVNALTELRVNVEQIGHDVLSLDLSDCEQGLATKAPATLYPLSLGFCHGGGHRLDLGIVGQHADLEQVLTLLAGLQEL